MSAVALGTLIAIVLAALLLAPYLVKEIRRGKANVGARQPLGPGDTHPGTRANPAPGHIEGRIDPYDEQARR
jgi:hypothetical protein